ncbi:hypothetical protein B0H13DRAFT_2311827 [Mycena leptocephala]|nr:hypothetical protein B0H13DRAFT_2311827 [Mycena leptocephala]
MSQILAAIEPVDIRSDSESKDSDGRALCVYVDKDRQPHRVLVLGQLVRIVDLDNELRLAVLGCPVLKSPVIRAMFLDQLKVLHSVMRETTAIARVVVAHQPWCQTSADIDDGFIYVRITPATTSEISDLSTPSSDQQFGHFATEVPVVHGDPSAFELGGLVAFAVDMFRVDMPILSISGAIQDVYDRTHGLNASSIILLSKYLLSHARIVRSWFDETAACVLPALWPSSPGTMTLQLDAAHKMDLEIPTLFLRTTNVDFDVWYEQLETLSHSEFGPQVLSILKTMSAKRLFDTALASVQLYALVAAYLEFLRHNVLKEDCSVCQESGLYPAHSTGTSVQGLINMPVEVVLRIVRHMDLVDRSRLAQTSRAFAYLERQKLQGAATKILSRFGLRFAEVRLMQSAIGVILAGSAVTALIRIDSAFQPDTLDFVVGSGRAGRVTTFLDRAAGYTFLPEQDPSIYTPYGMAITRTLRNVDGMIVNVIESLSDNPFDVVGGSALSCAYGYWAATGLLHCYPRLTCAGIALTTPTKLCITDNQYNKANALSVLRQYIARGFSIALNEFDAPHTCGSDWSCPATPRTTSDRGCSFSAFSSWKYDDEALVPNVSCWTLGGSGCTRGILAHAGKVISSVTSIHDNMWKNKITRCIDNIQTDLVCDSVPRI